MSSLARTSTSTSSTEWSEEKVAEHRAGDDGDEEVGVVGHDDEHQHVPESDLGHVQHGSTEMEHATIYKIKKFHYDSFDISSSFSLVLFFYFSSLLPIMMLIIMMIIMMMIVSMIMNFMEWFTVHHVVDLKTDLFRSTTSMVNRKPLHNCYHTM